MKIIRLEDDNNFIFEKICEWNYNWWGRRDGKSVEEVRCNLKHSLNKHRLPHTFVALIGEEPVGMYQLAMFDDLDSRPDIYPWLINVYVDEKFRGKNVCRKLMETVNENAKKANLQELYLYTTHIGYMKNLVGSL
ncbi:MAG: GNAT family N-acetyltransferase [Lysinibacillus sp.]|nr:GNAT family N-acetyltransferase [Lysinibacillus sp.]